MITYLYWIAITGLIAGAIYFIGYKMEQLKMAMISSVIILLVGTIAYFFHFQQIFVKRFGGEMAISVPKGQYHIAATWKDDNLWIENYDPETNTCHFREYSRGNLLEGQVVIKNCNPLLPKVSENAPVPEKIAPGS